MSREAAPGGQPWLNERKALRLYLDQRDGKKVDPSGFVFVSQKGGQLTTNALWRMFQTRAEAAGVKGPLNPFSEAHKSQSDAAAGRYGHRDGHDVRTPGFKLDDALPAYDP